MNAQIKWMMLCLVPMAVWSMGCGHSPASTRGDGAWVIHENGVGDLSLDQPLPSTLLSRLDGAEYIPRYIADGVSFDGMRFQEEGLLIGFVSGPFQRGEPAYEEMDGEKMAVVAREEIRAGTKVDAIYVEGSVFATAEGIGVGNTLRELAAAYPDHMLHPLPPTFGNDRCLVVTPVLPNVTFVFESCEKAGEGSPIVRVDIWRESEEE